MSKHILITGGGGFIGSHVADELLRAGYRVRALDNLSPQVHGPGWEQFAVLIRSAAHWAQQRGKKTVLGGLSCVDPHWLAAMCDRGVSQYIDAVGIHGYPVTFEFRSEGWEPMAGRIRETLDAQGSDA